MAEQKSAGHNEKASSALPVTRIQSCGDISCEFLVDPIPRPRADPFTIRLKPEIQQVVFVDNRKPNSLEILRRTQALLRARGVDVRDKIMRKPEAGSPMPEAMLGQLAQEKGLILHGVSD